MTRVRLVLLLVVTVFVVWAIAATIISEIQPCFTDVPVEEGGCPDL